MGAIILAGALGAALAYFLDPDNGEKRRERVHDRFTSSRDQVGNKVQHMVHRDGSNKGETASPTSISDVRNEAGEQIHHMSA